LFKETTGGFDGVHNNNDNNETYNDNNET